MKNKLISDFIKKHALSYVIGIVFMLIASYIQSLFPKVLGIIIDILKTPNFDPHNVKIHILYLMLIAVGTFLANFVWRNLILVNSRKLECSLRESLFYHFQKLSPEFYSKHKTGDLIAYSINDILAVRMTFGPVIAMSVNSIALCSISIYSMCTTINYKITMIALIPIPAIIFVMFKVGNLVQRRFRKVQENFASISDRVQENIYGIRVIKAYAQEDKEVKKFEKLNNTMMKSNIDMVRASSFLTPTIQLCFSISFVINLIWCGNMVLNGTISLGTFVAFNGYLTMIMNPIVSICRIMIMFQRGLASSKRLKNIFDEKPKVVNGRAMLSPSVKGDIEFKNLNFSYKDSSEPALCNINLKIKAGTTLGIVGKTGSGKSTLVELLLKLYNVNDNTIFIDGHDINDYSLQGLRNAFGYVPQDNFLFRASIKNNIKFFKDTFKDEEVYSACKNSCIYDSIISFPNKFDTIIGERGVNLSGGQKQRLSIARALIKDPPILILDDSLSAVDTITEEQIINNLKDIRKNKTTIIIAHRLSAVRNADNIIVLNKGHIVEMGTHEELINKGGEYYEIYKEQYVEKKDGLEAS